MTSMVDGGACHVNVFGLTSHDVCKNVGVVIEQQKSAKLFEAVDQRVS